MNRSFEEMINIVDEMRRDAIPDNLAAIHLIERFPTEGVAFVVCGSTKKIKTVVDDVLWKYKFPTQDKRQDYDEVLRKGTTSSCSYHIDITDDKSWIGIGLHSNNPIIKIKDIAEDLKFSLATVYNV